ncbi:MAG: hypothetical protein ACOC0Q_08135 [Wenzhouxiangella sp.]
MTTAEAQPKAQPKKAQPKKESGTKPELSFMAAGKTGKVLVHKIWVTVVTDGDRPAMETLGLHEVVLARRKLQMHSCSLRLMGEWPEAVERLQPLGAADLTEEYARLQARYTYDRPDGREGETVDLVMDVYGPAHQRRLLTVMRRIEEAWREMEATLEEDQEPPEEYLRAIADLADPDSDFADESLWSDEA